MQVSLSYNLGNHRYSITQKNSSNTYGVEGSTSGPSVAYQFNPVYANTIYELPNVGNVRTMYIVGEDEYKSIYMWDAIQNVYYLVANNYNEIDIINGGDSNE